MSDNGNLTIVKYNAQLVRRSDKIQPKLWEATACGKWGVTTAPDLLEGRSGTFR
jgi:hypothetical protein